MEAQFHDGPLDAQTLEIPIAFQVIDVYELPDGTAAPIFEQVSPNSGLWQYNLAETDWDTYAVYYGTKVGGGLLVTAEEDIWTAAGEKFDVLSTDGQVDVEVNGDEITFPLLDISVRLAQRQGE